MEDESWVRLVAVELTDDSEARMVVVVVVEAEEKAEVVWVV